MFCRFNLKFKISHKYKIIRINHSRTTEEIEEEEEDKIEEITKS
jgi:hypothetical protein